MKFTVIFNSQEGMDLSYGLIFAPCPIWVKGENEIINLNPDNPHYKIGSIKRLIDAEKIKQSIINENCIVVIHNIGNANKEDLENLKLDFENEGFSSTFAQLM